MAGLTTKPLNRGAPKSLFVSISCPKGVLVIRPTGPRLAEREAVIIAAEARLAMGALGRALRGLVLDLTDVHMMSSFGLGMCIELRNSAHTAGAPAFLLGLSNELVDMFRLMKVDRLYTIVQSPAELARAMTA